MIKSQQDPADMLKKMADSMNLTVSEFETLMREEHGLVPPDDEDEYYEPPKRKMSVVALTPDAARKEADRCRKLLLDPGLSRYAAEELANHIAQCVSGYSEVDARIEELKLPESNKTEAQGKASCSEHNALVRVRDDKVMTTHQANDLNSVTSTLGLMNRGKFAGQPIDLIAFKEEVERQMDELTTSGTARERRIAQFVIMAQQSAEKLLVNAAHASTEEASALVMEKASKIMHTATKMLESLDDMATPKAGRLVEHVPDKQLPNKTKSPSEPTFEVE